VHICIQATSLHTDKKFELIGYFFKRNRFHVTIRIVSPTFSFKRFYFTAPIVWSSITGLINYKFFWCC